MLVLEVGDHRQSAPGFEAEGFKEGNAGGVAFEKNGDEVFKAEVVGGVHGVVDEIGGDALAVGREVDVVADFSDGPEGFAA